MEKNLREVARKCICHVYTKKANSEVTGYTYHVQKSKQSNIRISLKCCTNLSTESSDYKVTHLLVCTVHASAKDFTLYLNLSTALRAVFTRFMWRCEENEEEELGKIEAIGRTWTAIIWKTYTRLWLHIASFLSSLTKSLIKYMYVHNSPSLTISKWECCVWRSCMLLSGGQQLLSWHQCSLHTHKYTQYINHHMFTFTMTH